MRMESGLEGQSSPRDALRLNTLTALAHLYSIVALNRWERGSIGLRRESREYIYMAYMKMYV